MNKFEIKGNLVRDPVLKGKDEKACVFFTVAVNRASGNADFIGVKAFRKLAESVAKKLKKGSCVEIEGHISTSSYKDKDGETKYTTDLIAERIKRAEREATVGSDEEEE